MSRRSLRGGKGDGVIEKRIVCDQVWEVWASARDMIKYTGWDYTDGTNGTRREIDIISGSVRANLKKKGKHTHIKNFGTNERTKTPRRGKAKSNNGLETPRDLQILVRL